jgi:hypothetical protein
LNDDDEYFFEDVVEFIKARLWAEKLNFAIGTKKKKDLSI